MLPQDLTWGEKATAMYRSDVMGSDCSFVPDEQREIYSELVLIVRRSCDR